MVLCARMTRIFFKKKSSVALLLGLEFDPGEKEAWNADALVEGVRAGTGRGDFLAALEDRVTAEETQWAPFQQLHFPDLLDDYLNEVLVETAQ